MKLLVSIALAACMFWTLPSQAQSTAKETLVVQTRIYCDHCQRCESCGMRIYNSLKELRGVGKVSVNDSEQTISVAYRPDKVTPDQIRKAINNAGYDADDQPARAEAVSRLDKCCRKR